MTQVPNSTRVSRYTRRDLVKTAGALAGTAAAAGGAAGLPAGVAARSQQPRSGGTLTVGLPHTPPTIDPHRGGSAPTSAVRGLVYSQLLRFSYDRELVPDLAETFEMVDETTYIFHLRPNVTFHDGTPLTSDDVVASYQRITDPATGSRVYADLEVIDTITAHDELTVEFKLKNPQSPFLTALGLPGNSIVQKSMIDNGVDFESEMVGTGPFRFRSHTVGVSTEIERNTDYFLPELPYLDEVIFRPIEDPSALMNALYSGNIDIATYVPWTHMAELEEHDSYTLGSNPADGFIMLECRVDRPPLDNPLLRQAISYGINREAIVSTVTSGRGAPCTGGIIPPWMWAYNEELVDTYPYDPEKARELIREAGAEGMELEFTTNPASDLLIGRPSVVVANNLSELGFNVKVKTLGIAASLEVRDSGEYQLFADGSLYSMPDPDFLSDYYHTDGRIPKANRFSDPQIDEWLDAARQITDQEERKPIYHDVEARVLELAPIIWLFYREQGDAWTNEVQGYEYLGSQGSSNAILETWLDR